MPELGIVVLVLEAPVVRESESLVAALAAAEPFPSSPVDEAPLTVPKGSSAGTELAALTSAVSRFRWPQNRRIGEVG